VVVVDLRLAGQSGARLAQLLAAEHPGLRLVVFTAVDDLAELRDLLDVPVHGIVAKSGSVAELARAIRTVAAGGRHVPAGVDATTGVARRSRLSAREREILALLADGCDAEDIAVLLHIAPETVRTHIRNARQRLGAHTRTHAVALALRAGQL
jgi:two-component system response regulator DesR